MFAVVWMPLLRSGIDYSQSFSLLLRQVRYLESRKLVSRFFFGVKCCFVANTDFIRNRIRSKVKVKLFLIFLRVIPSEGNLVYDVIVMELSPHGGGL